MTMKSEIYLTKKKRRTFNLVYHQQDGSEENDQQLNVIQLVW